MQPGLSNADLLAIHQPFQRYFDNVFYFTQAPWSDKVTGPAHLNKTKQKKHTTGSDHWTKKKKMQLQIKASVSGTVNTNRKQCHMDDFHRNGCCVDGVVVCLCLPSSSNASSCPHPLKNTRAPSI